MKLVIWDLDNTIWDGIIFHGEKVVLKPEAKEVLKQIDKIGVKQVVCSYNELDNCLKRIKEFGIDTYFSHVKASTRLTKDVMIQELLESCDILPEETLFIDDSILNRELVKMSVGCHVDFDDDLYQIMKYFDTNRLVLMNQQRNRLNAENTWCGSKEDFMREVGNEISIKLGEETEIPRLTTLSNRTNELNASRNRYKDEEIEKFIKDNDYIVYVAYLKDKFGDYGLIGEVIIEVSGDSWFVKDICVSCRTMGRGVASSLIKYVIDKIDVKLLTGVVVINEDNWRMTRLFEKFNFKKVSEEDKKVYYELKI